MSLIFTFNHPDLAPDTGKVLERQAARAVVIDGDDLLLLYTRRYDDYSFPGGGLGPGESTQDCLLRELREETGATGVRVGDYLGYVDEMRPWGRDGFDTMSMRSHFYLCRADRVLGASAPETYEVANGMVPVWLDIGAAVAHNEAVLRSRPGSMGMSIHRETQMLKYVAGRMLAAG